MGKPLCFTWNDPGLGGGVNALSRHHYELLAAWRGRTNLVGPGPLEPHFEDAEAALDLLREPAGRWADLGSGAGFPGLVFAARFPGVEIDLVDSRKRRCAFLRRVLATSPVPCRARVLCARVEDLTDGAYSGVLARAFAPAATVAAHAARLLADGGLALWMAGPDARAWDEPFAVLDQRAYHVAGSPRKALLMRRECGAIGAFSRNLASR